jgi:hypothetical protein
MFHEGPLEEKIVAQFFPMGSCSSLVPGNQSLVFDIACLLCTVEKVN